jgi:uncharacterized protein (TIGR03118 family)
MSSSTFSTVAVLEPRRLLAATPAAPKFTQTDLVSNGVLPAQHTDANLVNGWGLAFTKQGVVWVGNNGTGTSTVYDVAGNVAGPVVAIPPAANSTENAPVTGVVFNAAAKGFNVTANGQTLPSQYVFVSESGTISGWTPEIGNTAVNVVDNSASGAAYKGAAIAGKGKKTQLLVANFQAGTVEVYDQSFQPVAASGAFTDPAVPADFAPFNVQVVGSKVYVAYARKDPNSQDDLQGPGNGVVGVFDAKGKLKGELASGGVLNSPWAVIQGTGAFKKNLLVGNFGDGTINVFTPKGKSIGAATDNAGQPITIPGLWGLAYGTGANKNTLFFAAGPNTETAGLFGTLTLISPPKLPSGGGDGGGGGGFPY